MKFISKIFIHITFILFFTQNAWSTHIRAGEIQFSKSSGYLYNIVLVLYTDSKGINQTEIDIDFGDGTTQTVERDPMQRTWMGNDIYYNHFPTTHLYSGPGTYKISCLDRNRCSNIVNMQNSVNTAFYVCTLLTILPSGGSRSPILLRPPIDFACVDQIFVHNPNAYDPDGDSLGFSLINPQKADGISVDGYFIPPAKHSFTINSRTGQVIWDYPENPGIYNIAILIEKFRNGVRIGYVIRDMQIIVNASCDDHPPVIQPIADTCVEGGSPFALKIPIKATDIDSNQIITLTASGGPFLPPGTAQLLPNPAYGSRQVNAQFYWLVGCDFIREQPYQVVIKAIDNDPVDSLADLEPFFIQVVGPAPENPKVTATLQGNLLTWDRPHNCFNEWGYNIYRRTDSSHWDTSRCHTGIPGYTGFVLIDKIRANNIYQYLDNNLGTGLVPGVRYCYRITATYLNPGNYVDVEGYASDEVCAFLRMDIPVITHASVRTTDNDSGSVFIDWAKPMDVDTLTYLGPYKYKIYRQTNTRGTSPILIDTITSKYFSQLNDTAYYDTFLNTKKYSYSYYIEFYCTDSSKDYLVGKTQVASTVFLNVSSTFKSLVLNWNESVPWNNYHYIIFRKNDTTGLFDSIGISFSQNFKDTGLVDGKTYCYKVQSYGSYLGTHVYVNPIKNFSQIQCTFPRDTFPPCPPVLDDSANCLINENILYWKYDSNAVCDSSVVAFKIYFKERLTNAFLYIGKANGHNTFTYSDNRPELAFSKAGCYVITAVDIYDNESIFSNEVCIDNCPNYIIPNVFTPNGDGINDTLIPCKGSMHIEKVNMRIYNRWGQLVFQTTNPRINWDGKDMATHKACSEGTYFYVCDIDKMYLEGNKSVRLSGTITLLR